MCQLTLFQLAVHFKQSEAALWLRGRGAVPDLLSAWDLDWSDHFRARIQRRPEQLTRRRGRWQTTILHWAASRGDVPLIQLLLELGADSSARDGSFGGTPADWANDAGHCEAAAILKSLESS